MLLSAASARLASSHRRAADAERDIPALLCFPAPRLLVLPHLIDEPAMPSATSPLRSVLPLPLSSPLLQTPSRQINHTHSTLVRTILHHHHYSAPCSEPNTHRCRARQTPLFPCTTTNNPSPHPLFSPLPLPLPLPCPFLVPSLPLPCSTNSHSRPLHPLRSLLLQTPSRQINHTHSTLVRTTLQQPPLFSPIL
jgi:hypothetical protein